MNKIAISLLLLFAAPSYAQSGSYSAHDGPARMFVSLNSEPRLNLNYDGYLYECVHPSYLIRRITAYFIFHKTGETKVLARQMNGLCTTPWNYTAPDLAYYQDYEPGSSDRELWVLLRETLFGDASGRKPILEVAFEYQGRWDSDYGRNFRLDFTETMSN